jgi:hypothetical protein
VDERNESRFGETCSGLPPDIINFQHDGLACAIALGWRDGVSIEQTGLHVELRDGFLTERVVDETVQAVFPPGSSLGSGNSAAPDTHVRLVTHIDGPRFNEFWLRRLTAN